MYSHLPSVVQLLSTVLANTANHEYVVRRFFFCTPNKVIFYHVLLDNIQSYDRAKPTTITVFILATPSPEWHILFPNVFCISKSIGCSGCTSVSRTVSCTSVFRLNAILFCYTQNSQTKFVMNYHSKTSMYFSGTELIISPKMLF